MKNILKSVWKSIVFWLLNFAYVQLFNLIDEDKNGELSDKEIKDAIEKLKMLLKTLKAK